MLFRSSNPDVYLGAPDDPYDGVVTDCASAGDYDADADGHTSADYGGDDCDDARSDVYTGAEETWYDGIDQDCDGNDTDQDGDGWTLAYDCDDTDAAAYPGATEVWYDGADEDCDGLSDYDQDFDGYDSADYGGVDCDDTEFSVNPAAVDTPYDGVDSDCSGTSD